MNGIGFKKINQRIKSTGGWKSGPPARLLPDRSFASDSSQCHSFFGLFGQGLGIPGQAFFFDFL
jgi:hypothetical protein